MLAVGKAYAWSFWARHRIETVVALAYMAGVVLLVHLSPPSALTPGLVGQLTIPLWCFLPFVIGMFCFGLEANIDACDTGYPRRIFTLPLSNRALAGWPLALGAIAVSLYWVVLGGLILRAGGLPAPVLWVAVFLVALLAWTQALTWYPFALAFLRVIVLVVVLGSMTTLAVLAFRYEVSPLVLLGVSAALIPPGYLLALRGVARARCGEVVVRRWPVPWRRAAAPALPFASSAAAQFWLEWRRHGFVLPLFVGLILLPELLLLAFSSQTRQGEFQAGTFLVSQYVLMPLLGAWAGAALGNCNYASRSIAPAPSFIAALPLRAGALLAAKMRVAVWSTALTSGMALVAMMLLLPMSPAGQVLMRWQRWLIETRGTSGVLLGLLFMALWPLLLFKGVVNQLWIGLAGREWVVVLVSLLVPIGVLVPGLTICWLDPDPQGRGQLLLVALPWAVGMALGMKLAFGGLVVRANYRRGLIRRNTLHALVATWLVAAAALIGLSFGLVPAEGSPLLVAAAAVLLLLPLVRLGLAPLALEWNRHR